MEGETPQWSEESAVTEDRNSPIGKSRTGDTSTGADSTRESAAHHRTAITAAFRVASGEFELGRTIATAPISRIEFDPSLSSGESVRSQFRAETGDADALETALGKVGSIETVTGVEGGDTESLLQIEWAASIDGLIGYLTASEATVLEAVGTPDEWRFECRFDSGERLSAFHDACVDDGISIDLLRLHHSANSDSIAHS